MFAFPLRLNAKFAHQLIGIIISKSMHLSPAMKEKCVSMQRSWLLANVLDVVHNDWKRSIAMIVYFDKPQLLTNLVEAKYNSDILDTC